MLNGLKDLITYLYFKSLTLIQLKYKLCKMCIVNNGVREVMISVEALQGHAVHQGLPVCGMLHIDCSQLVGVIQHGSLYKSLRRLNRISFMVAWLPVDVSVVINSSFVF